MGSYLELNSRTVSIKKICGDKLNFKIAVSKMSFKKPVLTSDCSLLTFDVDGTMNIKSCPFKVFTKSSSKVTKLVNIVVKSGLCNDYDI